MLDRNIISRRSKVVIQLKEGQIDQSNMYSRVLNGSQYDKPLNLKLQWILKEMKEKSQIIGSMRRTTSGKLRPFFLFDLSSFSSSPFFPSFNNHSFSCEEH